ncbi:DHA2 family efflux MFS transporter permease subunit [Acidocella sp.]|uniref:DHA2 family efflux MFS transporter permease subunit n=1 Tax=Acidocella sp. TaxID=50710 RepID=UPI002630F5B5|nr:DHA2 family efflux MFS transporter permease subunit [Acidocella sp.]
MSQSQTTPVPAYKGLPLVIITASVMLGTLIQTLDSTIANVALPYMQGSMSASQDEINWVLTSYIITSAIMTAPTSFLASRFGRTRIFIVSIAGFTVASVLCGMSQSLTQIVMFRLIQGAFGGALVPLSQTVLLEIFSLEKRAAAMALWGIGVQVGPIIGPIIGGWLTQNLSWRWVFYVNIPFGILATLGLLFFLKETKVNTTMRMDWLGFGALSLGIGALQLVLDRGEIVDWFSAREIVIEACLAAIGFYLFAVQTVLAPKPFLSPKLFTDGNFLIGTAMIFLIGLNLYATLALFAPYLQNLSGDPVITAGFLLAPRGGGTIIAMLIAGRLVGHIDVRFFVGTGFIAGALALYQFAQWTPDVSHTKIIVWGMVQGFSVGFIFMPLTTVIYATLPTSLRTEAAGVFSLLRNMGSAIGISITGALLTTNTQVNHAILGATITPFNHMLQSGALGRFWNPAHAAGAALLNSTITRQAQIISYANDFWLMFILTLVVMPLVLLIRPGRAGITAAAQPAAPQQAG